MSPSTTISEILEKRAAEQGTRPAYVFLSYGEDGVAEERLTYGELDARARSIGASLLEAGAGGERVVLLFPPGPDFVASFFGCLYAGAVAVPALPPRRRGADPRLSAICRDARPRVALTSAGQLPVLEGAAAQIPELAAALRMAPAMEGGEGWRRPEVPPEALAFLQYTSGSTSTPKGVMVSHGNLAHNEELIRQAFVQSPESVVLGWLPLYHDMGLIGTMLQPLYNGAVSYLMTPGAFLQRPARWLEAISRYRATTSGGPNFAYELCVRKIGEAEREGLDLSSWEIAFNGAEPVRAGTLRRFAEAFAPCGFRASAFRPCYGLAEATLLVSGWKAQGEEPRVRAFDAEALERNEALEADTGRSRELVGCGAAMQTVVAVDAETGEACAPGRVGEVWVASPSVAHGYWNRPEESAATFGARLADGSGPFLRTGDLGFVDGGEVFLTGRLKDLIILRGRNHYPQDLELTAERSHAALRAGGGAAFAVDLAGEERLVIVHEVERHARAGMEDGKSEEIAAAVRQAVAGEHEVSVAEVVLIGPETLPRTSSGKVRRRACRELYLEGGLRVLGASRLSPAAVDEDPRSGSEAGSPEWLRRVFAAAARIDPQRVDPDLPLAAAGLDSLAAVELKQAVEEGTGVSLPLGDLLEGMTLRELERVVSSLGPPASPPARLLPELEGRRDAGGPREGLSWNQRSLWFLHRLAPESSAYNIAGAARVGSVSPEALGRAVQGLVDRHPMLRATFADTPAGPVQRVAERGAAGFAVVEAEGWSDAEVEARLRAEAQRPFDLEAGPLLRAVLVRRGEEAFLGFAVHHVAADFWSMAVLARELGALVAGEAPPPPAARYTDFAGWQERMLASPAGERLWERWRERLDGAPQLDLPTDRPRRPVQTLRGGALTLPPSPERAAAVHRLAAAHGCTPFVALLAAWQTVLSRWSGQEDFLTGAPMAGRSAREWAEVVGYFVNLVPLRADLSGDPNTGELMARTRSAVLGALADQDFPFALLAERLQPERDPSRPPLVAAMLTYEKAPSPELAALAAFAVGAPGVRLDLGGLALESLPMAPLAAQMDLALTAAEWDAGLAVSLQWDADLFDAATPERMLGHLDRLLAGMAADRPVGELPMLAEAERHQVLTEWNDTAVEKTEGVLAHELFEAQAARTPDAPAVTFQRETLTYAELDARADRLAGHLRRLGCAAESRVGIALERSLDLVVSLLGALKAGATYVPLDPDYPPERLAFVVKDAAPVVVIDQPLEEMDGPAERVQGDDRQLAYVLYTSGSTGRPKGVGVPHRALVNFLASMRNAPGFAPGERLLAVTSLSFDIAALEIFLPLTVGGHVVLASRAEAADGALLAARLRESGAAVLQATPATWRMLIDSGWTGDPGLRALCGGEALPRDLAEALAGRTAELWNLYGPTETTIWSSAARVRAGEAGPVSIGRPIAETQIHLLDRHLRTVPPGAPGELWIGGGGLARGYLGRPDLTAERFLPNPYGEAGSRLYRTGDLARHLSGGRMEVLGRVDHQVKVRGFRIELGEIEAALLALPGVREAVVVARDSPSGDRQLVAYVVGDAGDPRRALRERLPDYMVPAAFVTLAAFPLTPNGKVDRKALPAPEWEGAGGDYRAPRTPVEEIVAGVWAEVLGIERVGAADHFFELGGHSLLAARVMSRLRAALGVEGPLRELFAAPRLADFAARVGALRGEDAPPPAPPLVPAPRDGAPPLSFAQRRLWFVDQLEPGSPLYNMPGALRAEGELDAAVLARCLAEIVGRHEALRTVFAAPEGSPVQVILPARPFPLPVADLSALPRGEREEAARALLREEAARPFDLAHGPLLRGLLLRLDERDHLVALALHHIAGDGWSLGVLAREIAALYPAFAAGEPSPLPPLPVQYADFAVWQRSWLRGEVLEREIEWWRGRLAGLPPLLELPTDRPRPAAQSHRGATLPLRLPAEVVWRAEALGRREGATLFMVLLAAFQTLLARYSGQDDLAVGTPVAGRDRVETEGLIGLFVNTLVLRGDLSGAPVFSELLGRARETALAAWLHQDAPFEKLVEELAAERSLAHAPLFQTVLALQNAPGAVLEIPGLRLSPLDAHAGTAKFDLTVNLEERGGGLAGTVEYAADLFDAATVERLTGHFERLLAAAVASPERGVFELPWLGETERHQLLRWWSDTASRFPREATIHALFAEQAAARPRAIAVEMGGERVTYRELHERAGRLARRLAALGVRPEERVAVWAERSPDLIAALLGILQAGGAYLPVDPADPAERQAWKLRDAGASLLVAPGAGPAFAPPPGVRLVAMDGEGPEAAPPEVPATALAYVLYTSGSTGAPKGVAVTHRNVVRLVRGADYAEMGPDQTWLQFAPVSFDASTLEIWAPLLNGGRLALFPGRMGSLDELARVLEDHRVTSAWLTAGLFHEMVDGHLEGLRPLSQLLTGGDVVSPEHARRALEAHPGLVLIDGYGPTEGTTFTCCHRLTAPEQVGESLPIGKPIANTHVHVLDERGAPVPVGVWGELYAGGEGVARGYLGRPDLTAASFLPDPFASKPGARLYRTGDLVRWTPEGELLFLGRRDQQVKIRGFRIEPGEIEAVLAALPGVSQAAVVVRDDGPSRRLAAYVAGDVETEALRAGLRERLPDYMVPAAFVLLPALPLTPNGKVDRRALPAPERGTASGYVAPDTREERILAEVWARVLRLPRVGVEDNFFELGGDSILSVQIVARARQAGLGLTVRQVFEHQTVAALARHATAVDASEAAGPVTGEAPLTPIQRWFFGRDFAEPHHFNQALALEPLEPLDPARLELAMGKVVEHHDALRMRFDGRRQVNAPAGGAAPFHWIDLSGLPAERRSGAFADAAAAVQAGFDLASGPLTRLCWFGDRLLWVTHHLVVDGVSWRVLVEDLEAAYRGEALPPRTSSFLEWARRLATYAGSPGELEHWRETVQAPVPALPVDFPAAEVFVRDEATVSFELSAEETADLLRTLPTVFQSRADEALLSALARAFAGWTGSPRLRVELEGHGREPLFDDLDVSRTVGWFTALYPVVLEGGGGGPGEALASARERLRAVPGRGLGYGLLGLQGEPAAEVLFNYLGQAAADSGGLFRASTEGTGPSRSPRARRTHALEIGGIVADGRLRISLTYGARAHRRETLERLAAAYAAALRELIGEGRRRLPDLEGVDDVYPLTPLQAGMLFHSLMAPESGVYVNQLTCALAADLDPALFRRAWEKLVERHAVLRTAFLWDGLDEPLQAVHRRVSLPWRELAGRFEELRQAEQRAPMPLGRAPLTRFALVRRDDGFGFIWTFHHLLLDGWSLPLLMRELAAVYAALREGREASLPPARPFADYVAWLQRRDPAREEAFWRGELAGFTAPNALGVVAPARTEGAEGYDEHRLQISREVTAELQALAARHKVTLQTVTLGAWALLASRYSGQEDVVFGNTVSGRPAALPGVESMAGMFINTLPARARVEDAAPLAPWLRRLQERQLAWREHEHTPLALVQRWSEVPAGSPLFETLYVFENYPHPGEGADGGLGIGDVRSHESTNYPVTLLLSAADHIDLRLMTDRARVDGDAAPRLLGHLAALLAGMAEGLERLAGEVGMLTAAETLQLRAWNDTDVSYALDRPLHAWIADQVRRTPEAVALVFEDEELTYAELDRRSSQLARLLQARGCGPESRVGVLLERSTELLVALHGILKAGAAYVPLDPEHPADRLAYQEENARLRLVITRAGLEDRLPVDGDGAPLSVPVDPGHPAYVLYTSGSTGRPKGAVISHRAIVNRLLWMQDALNLTPADRVLQKTPFSFDVSVWELFWPFMFGARLVVARPGGHRDNDYLARLIVEQGITVLHFVPSMLQLFLEEPGAGDCRSLRDVVCSGEALPAELARRFAARLPWARLHNLYGPTEAAVDVTSWVCGPGDEGGVPIGRPIANTRIHLLDPGLRPVPVGVPGELFIAGVNLARGYVERPDLTAERFLPDPEATGPGERVYRTGDLARWRPDGAIEYLGRLDHQVKIRGVRIELGEIEAALLTLPGVREAVVVARGEGAGKRLAAYMVGDASPDVVRQALRERLPDAMVPSVFVPLAALPLNANGKVDRKALPSPERPDAESGYVAPRTREEEILAAVWAQALRRPRVGVNDNFFALGGDSILSVQIVSRARQAGLAFTMREIFEHPTVAGLARHATVTDAIGAVQGPVTGEAPLTPIQRWFFAQGFAEPHHYNQALVLEAREPLDPAALERAMGQVVEHHDALRMRFHDGMQENAPAEVATPFHWIDLSGLPAERRSEAFERASLAVQASFDLAAGPLTRLCLFDGRLLWAAHHLVVDGVSWRVLVEDLETAYRQAALPPRTTSFVEWARRLAAHAKSEELAGELEHWRETARVPVPRLPVDFPASGDLLGDEDSVSFELTAEETTELLQTVPTTYHSRVDEALLSALVRALADWTGSPRLRVDLEGHGREPLFEDVDVSRTVGWFTTLYPVVLEAGDADPGAALVSAKERLRAVPGRGIGYGLLEAAGLLEPAPAEILFNYLGQADGAGETPAFRASMTAAGCRSPRAHRTHRLEIAGIVTDGRLRITLTYGYRTHGRETAERLSAAYAGALRQLIHHSRESEEVFTPSDFPKARLDARGFDRVAALLADID